MSQSFSDNIHFLRSRPAFGRVFLADALSQIGQNMLIVAFPTLILEVTHDVTLTGLAFSGEIIAYGLLSPWAGMLADRCEQKVLMVLSNLARALLLGILLWSLPRGFPGSFYLLLSVLLGASGALFGPARAAFLRRLLQGEELLAAVALEGTAGFLLRLISPALMGLLLLISDVRLGISLDAFLYLVSTALILPAWVSGPRIESPTGSGLGAREGWRFLLASPRLGQYLLMDVLISLVGMASWSTAVAFLEEVVHARAANNGWLQASMGIAGAIGTRWAPRLQRTPMTNAGILSVITISYLCLADATTLPRIVAVWFLRGLAIGVFVVMISQEVAREVPPHLMGRVQAAWEQAALLACFVGSVATPWLLRHLGPMGAFRLYAGMMLLFTVLWWMAVLRPRADKR